jgi:hypothetical protein
VFGLEGVECNVFKFLLFAHDIGRLEQGLQRVQGAESKDEDHGALSVHLILEALSMNDAMLTPIWNAMFCAIRCHSYRVTPTAEQSGDLALALPLVQLLRDTDKLCGWRSAKSYTGDKARQARERRANWPKQIIADPAWGNELGVISPPYLLWERFLNGKSLDRPRCRGYETYILQLLAWNYDVNTPEMLEIILATGGPKVVYDYIVERLMIGSKELESSADRDEAAHQLEALQTWGKTWHNGVLAQTT